MTHTCHAYRCVVPVKPEYLLCVAHWKMASPANQRLILEHFRKGQCDPKIESWTRLAWNTIIEVYRKEFCPDTKPAVMPKLSFPRRLQAR